MTSITDYDSFDAMALAELYASKQFTADDMKYLEAAAGVTQTYILVVV